MCKCKVWGEDKEEVEMYAYVMLQVFSTLLIIVTNNRYCDFEKIFFIYCIFNVEKMKSLLDAILTLRFLALCQAEKRRNSVENASIYLLCGTICYCRFSYCFI